MLMRRLPVQQKEKMTRKLPLRKPPNPPRRPHRKHTERHPHEPHHGKHLPYIFHVFHRHFSALPRKTRIRCALGARTQQRRPQHQPQALRMQPSKALSANAGFLYIRAVSFMRVVAFGEVLWKKGCWKRALGDVPTRHEILKI